MAVFDSPARGIVCAAAIRETLADLGLTVRSGLHIARWGFEPRLERSSYHISGVSPFLAISPKKQEETLKKIASDDDAVISAL